MGEPAIRAGVILLALFLAPGTATAHPLAPALLDIEELQNGRVAIAWKTSLVKAPGTNVGPVLPSHCKKVNEPVVSRGPGSVTTRWTMDCGPAGLVGQRVGFSGLADAKIDALVRVTTADGRLVQSVVRAARPFLTVPERQRPFDVLRGYAELGVEHILSGLDHLLFVFGLLLLVDGARMLIKTVTAFTIGHSVSLSLAALGIVNFPSRPIEVAIALSVFLLAVELARGERSSPTLMRRWPWAAALAFGLLHGLGFAAALAEVGLPEADIPLALFSFNLGIELGQLLFVAAALSLKWALGPLFSKLPRWAEQVPLYAMGSLAAFWCFERAAAVFS